MSLVLQVLLFLSLATAAAKAAGALSVRAGQPSVFGEIVAGVLLGPSLLDVLRWPVFASVSEAATGTHGSLDEVIRVLAEIGVLLLMFIAGLETDLEAMRRVGRVAFSAATGGVLLPLASGTLAAHLFGYGWGEGFFMGAVLTATSVSISAQTLMELGALRSREGSAILGAAVIDDVMGILVLSFAVALAGQGSGGTGAAGGAGTAAIACVRMALFFAVAWFAGRRLVPALASAVGRLRVSEPLMALVVVTAFAYAFAAEALGGVAAITSSYLAGLLFARSPLKERIDVGIHPLTYSFFVPVFFIDIGLRADVRSVGDALPLTAFILIAAILGKVVGCGGAARLAGFGNAEALRVGVGMISRGEVGLIVAGYGLAHGIIDLRIFSVMVLMVLVTTMITPVWLRLVFPRPGPAPKPETGARERVSAGSPTTRG